MKTNNVPCTLNFSKTSANSNLLEVKIVVMHEGENRNGSAFSMTSIEEARETLKNVPILGYILRSDDGQPLDFDEHNMSVNLVEGKNGYELREFYEEQIIGIIPETNNYHYELIDGVNHVCCTGYIYKSYSNGGADLLNEADSKGVSMEIAVDEGKFIDNIYHINKYQYQAVTILGDHVPQGMNGTCHIKKFSYDNDTKQTIENICKEIQKVEQGKEDISMTIEKAEFEATKKIDDTVVEPVEEPVVEAEEVVEEQPKTEEVIEETKEEQVDDVVEEIVEETVEVEEVAEEVAEAEETDEFACGDKKKKKYEEDEEEKKEEFSLECFSVFFEEVPATINEVCNALVEKFNSLNSEIEALKEFKATIERESLISEVNEICTEFDFAEEEISEMKEKAYNSELTLDGLRKELFALEGMKLHAKKKANFSKKENEVKPKISVFETEKEIVNEPYGGLFKRYQK